MAAVSEGEASVSVKIRISDFRCCLRIFSGTKRWVRFLERRLNEASSSATDGIFRRGSAARGAGGIAADSPC